MQLLKFCAAGAVGTVLYYLILYSLTEYIGVWYLASAIVAYALNSTSNFVLQKFWTFGNSDIVMIRHQANRYVLLSGGLFAANTVLLYGTVEYLHLWYLYAQVCITIVLTLVSFAVSRRIFA